MSKRDEKRAEILEFVTGKVTEEGYVPSVREICKAVGLSSPATVHYHLNQLCEEGLISKEPNKKRFIRLSNQSSGTSYVKVPLVGRVPCAYTQPRRSRYVALSGLSRRI